MIVTYIDPQTGGYTFADGVLVKHHHVVNKANRLLAQVIGSDFKNPTFGNPLITSKNLTPNEIINGINYSLNPLLSTGELSRILILRTWKTILQRWNVDIAIYIPSQQDAIELTWAEKITNNS